MPKAVKVSVSERKLWLDQWENGGRVDEIAKKAGRGPRAVKDHIAIARAERDLTVVRQGQLRGALEAHQRDMSRLLSRLRLGVDLPQLEYPRFLVGFGPDFGLEGLLDPAGLAPFDLIGLGPALGKSVILPQLEDGRTVDRSVYVLRDHGGPKEVHFTEEATRLWKSLREHLPRNPLWKDLDQWKLGLREMLRARAQLNQAVQSSIEEIFRMKVLWAPGPEERYLSTAFVSWLGCMVTNKAGGASLPDPAGEVKVEAPGRLAGGGGGVFAHGVKGAVSKQKRLWKEIPGLVSAEPAQVASRTEGELIQRTRKLKGTLEDLSLIPFVPGTCSNCRRLGGA